MSDLSLLDQLKQQLQQFITQRDQVHANFNQLVGAIFATEQMIKKHEDDKLLTDGGQGNGGEMDSENAHEEGCTS
jgi:chaperonin cofactor prefoldin